MGNYTEVRHSRHAPSKRALKNGKKYNKSSPYEYMNMYYIACLQKPFNIHLKKSITVISFNRIYLCDLNVMFSNT